MLKGRLFKDFLKTGCLFFFKFNRKDRLRRFLELRNARVEAGIAELCDWNIKNELCLDQACGYIEFSDGVSWIVENTPRECRRIMSLLYEHATEICTCIEDNMVVQRLDFHLTD